MIPVCPRCDRPLMILAYKGIEVDACSQCGGVWFDAGEIEDLLERTGVCPEDPQVAFLTRPSARSAQGKRLCPRCDERMEEHRAPAAAGDAEDLTVDRCPRGHGVWFDRGEFHRLLARSSPSSGANEALAFLNEMFGEALSSPSRDPKA